MALGLGLDLDGLCGDEDLFIFFQKRGGGGEGGAKGLV